MVLDGRSRFLLCWTDNIKEKYVNHNILADVT